MYDVEINIWKYHKSMICLKALLIWGMYYTIKYAIINIELISLGVAYWCIASIVKIFINDFNVHEKNFNILMDGK